MKNKIVTVILGLGVGMGVFTPAMAAADFNRCFTEYMGCEDPAYPANDCFEKLQLCMKKDS